MKKNNIAFTFATSEVNKFGQNFIKITELCTGKLKLKSLYDQYLRENNPPENFWHDAVKKGLEGDGVEMQRLFGLFHKMARHDKRIDIDARLGDGSWDKTVGFRKRKAMGSPCVLNDENVLCDANDRAV